jgi:hypothetical protein
MSWRGPWSYNVLRDSGRRSADTDIAILATELHAHQKFCIEYKEQIRERMDRQDGEHVRMHQENMGRLDRIYRGVGAVMLAILGAVLTSFLKH